MQHFIIHSDRNFWSGAEIQWSWTNASNTEMQAQCASLTYRSSSKTRYAIVCPYDYSATSLAPGTTNKGITISGWKFPCNFGRNLPLGNALRYLWSGSQGNLLMYSADTSIANAVADDCAVST